MVQVVAQDFNLRRVRAGTRVLYRAALASAIGNLDFHQRVQNNNLLYSLLLFQTVIPTFVLSSSFPLSQAGLRSLFLP
jgi:hypothetical protein